MNKYGIKGKAKQATELTIVCIIALAVFVISLWGANVYKHYKGFSSPSSEVGVDSSAPAFIMRVSAYCPGSCCCGKWADGYTSSGVPAVGLIVAAPSDTKFGSVLDIPGYGRATVQDRGGAITGNRLDVLFPTHQEALNWGVQYVMVREIK